MQDRLFGAFFLFCLLLVDDSGINVRQEGVDVQSVVSRLSCSRVNLCLFCITASISRPSFSTEKGFSNSYEPSEVVKGVSGGGGRVGGRGAILRPIPGTNLSSSITIRLLLQLTSSSLPLPFTINVESAKSLSFASSNVDAKSTELFLSLPPLPPPPLSLLQSCDLQLPSPRLRP